MPRTTKRPVGRPVIIPNGAYVSVRFSRTQLNKIERIGGPAPGTRPGTIRRLVDLGIAVARKGR